MLSVGGRARGGWLDVLEWEDREGLGIEGLGIEGEGERGR
jgi:hypothetical protein